MDRGVAEQGLLRWLTAVYDRLKAVPADPKAAQPYAARIVFESIFELYLSAIKHPSTTVRATIARSMMECYADSQAIFRADDREAAAKDYIESASKTLNEAMSNLRDFLKQPKGQRKGRPMQDKGKWNGVSLTQRIIDIDEGSAAIHTYDMLCYFAHVNPLRQTLVKVVKNKDWLRGYTTFLAYATVRKSLESGLYTEEEIKAFDDLESLIQA
jgi:hypothetical protein